MENNAIFPFEDETNRFPEGFITSESSTLAEKFLEIFSGLLHVPMIVLEQEYSSCYSEYVESRINENDKMRKSIGVSMFISSTSPFYMKKYRQSVKKKGVFFKNVLDKRLMFYNAETISEINKLLGGLELDVCREKTAIMPNMQLP